MGGWVVGDSDLNKASSRLQRLQPVCPWGPTEALPPSRSPPGCRSSQSLTRGPEQPTPVILCQSLGHQSLGFGWEPKLPDPCPQPHRTPVLWRVVSWHRPCFISSSCQRLAFSRCSINTTQTAMITVFSWAWPSIVLTALRSVLVAGGERGGARTGGPGLPSYWTASTHSPEGQLWALCIGCLPAAAGSSVHMVSGQMLGKLRHRAGKRPRGLMA